MSAIEAAFRNIVKENQQAFNENRDELVPELQVSPNFIPQQMVRPSAASDRPQQAAMPNFRPAQPNRSSLEVEDLEDIQF